LFVVVGGFSQEGLLLFKKSNKVKVILYIYLIIVIFEGVIKDNNFIIGNYKQTYTPIIKKIIQT